MIIPESTVRTHFSRTAFYKAPELKFEMSGSENETLQKIQCIKAASFKGLLKRSSKDYTSLTLTRKNSGRRVVVFVKNADLKSLVGKTEFETLKNLKSSEKRFSHLKKCVGPLNPHAKSKTGQTLSSQISIKLDTLFPTRIGSKNREKVLRSINKMIVSKKSSIFALVEIKLDGKLEQVFLRKYKGKLLIEHAKQCGNGGNAIVYKAAGYALKKFMAVPCDEEYRDELVLKVDTKSVEKEIRACKDVAAVPGTLKVKAKLKEAESNHLIGFVTKAYDGDYGSYLLSSLNSPTRSLKLCDDFIELSKTFAEMHGLDKVHNDIKIENVFASFDRGNIQELVVGDIETTDLKNDPSSTTPNYNFSEELDKIRRKNCENPAERLSLRKNLDVRQFAFFMYYSICAEKTDEDDINLIKAFPSNFRSYPDSFPNAEERTQNYNPIPKEKAPRELRDYIGNLLTSDFEDLPSMEEVHSQLKEIYSTQRSKLLR